MHAKGSHIFVQIWALGRAARPAMLHKEFPDYPYVAASPIPLNERPDDVPRALTKEGTCDCARRVLTTQIHVHER